MIILDTDHLSLLSRDKGASRQVLEARLDRINPDDLFTTIITYEEQTRGWLAVLAAARSSKELVPAYRRLLGHLNDYRSIRIAGFDQGAGDVFDKLKSSRIRVGTMDLRIAAIAISREALLLSRNLGDFRKVPGLKVEDWTA